MQTRPSLAARPLWAAQRLEGSMKCGTRGANYDDFGWPRWLIEHQPGQGVKSVEIPLVDQVVAPLTHITAAGPRPLIGQKFAPVQAYSDPASSPQATGLSKLSPRGGRLIHALSTPAIVSLGTAARTEVDANDAADQRGVGFAPSLGPRGCGARHVGTVPGDANPAPRGAGVSH